jgi:hypothetical protein
MKGKYLFKRTEMFTSYNGYLISNSSSGNNNPTTQTDLRGAEITNMPPSFIITVKDIGVLFGGINPNNYYKLFEPFTKKDITNYNDNCYPIIFTDMPTIGGIDSNLINYVEFFDLYFLTNNIKNTNSVLDYDRLKKVTSFYYHFDDIRIGTEKFKRYAFYIHTNSFLNRIGYYFKTAGFINCKTQENIIISESLYNVMGNSKNCNNATYGTTDSKILTYNVDYQNCFCTTKGSINEPTTTGIINNSLNICFYGDWISSNNLDKIDKMPICGRGLPFSFRNNVNLTNDIIGNTQNTNNSCYGKRNSILSLLGWNKDYLQNISNKSPFKFIHRNIDTIETNIDEYSKVSKINQTPNLCNDVEYNFSMLPQNILNIEQISGNVFVFRSIPFIFLKISFPSLPEDTVSNQLIKTTSDKLETSNIYDEYYDDPMSNLNNLGLNYQTKPLLRVGNFPENTDEYKDLEEELERELTINANCGFKTKEQLIKKDTEILFAKINMNAVPGNAYNQQNYDYEFIFYDKPLQSIDTMNIEILSPDGELLNFRQDHNITLEIMEFRDVLKETLFDTRHGEVVTTGIKKV